MVEYHYFLLPFLSTLPTLRNRHLRPLQKHPELPSQKHPPHTHLIYLHTQPPPPCKPETPTHYSPPHLRGTLAPSNKQHPDSDQCSNARASGSTSTSTHIHMSCMHPCTYIHMCEREDPDRVPWWWVGIVHRYICTYHVRIVHARGRDTADVRTRGCTRPDESRGGYKIRGCLRGRPAVCE